MCCLTNNQIKNITAFWKAVITFITPEAEATTKQIHVSYSTCVREAQRKYDAAQERQRQMFQNCLYFSIALDTAQFGQENFLSCVCRFGFEDNISQ